MSSQDDAPLHPWFGRGIALTLAVGTLARVAPLFDHGGRLLRQFPTEDGYLMLTIARNLSLGHGMSTSMGTIPTNGTQPLFNLVEGSLFYLVGGDKHLGVLLALITQVLVSMWGAWALYRLARTVLSERPRLRRYVPGLAAATWYASSINIPHTMNCLETGLYATLVLESLLRWYRMFLARAPEQAAWGRAALLGLWLGATFWARIDAVFLIAAITGGHWLAGMRLDGTRTGAVRIGESFVMGATSVVVASPWLLNNLYRFGSVMPISGTAQTKNFGIGHNLPMLPPKLFEYFWLIVPVPLRFEQQPVVWWAVFLSVVGYLALLGWLVTRMRREEASFFAVAATMCTGLVGYYGIAFGAPHFVNRYMFPLAAFNALVTCIFAVTLVLRRAGPPPGLRRVLATVAALGALGLLVVTNARLYMIGNTHQHFQVVDWVNTHVDDDTWVGAIQTGTLGFFHDRTVNLDGKVNPGALEAKLAGQVYEYVVDARFGPEQRRIDYVVDWISIRHWYQGALKENFDMVVADEKKNLGVMRRRSITAQYSRSRP